MHKVPTLGCTFMDTPERRVLALSSELPFLPVLGRSRSAAAFTLESSESETMASGLSASMPATSIASLRNVFTSTPSPAIAWTRL